MSFDIWQYILCRNSFMENPALELRLLNGQNDSIHERKRVILSIAFGLIGFWGSLYSFSFAIPPHTVDLLWSLAFPLLAGLSWGWRYGLLSTVAGLAVFFPFYIWPSHGWACLAICVDYGTWFLLHAYQADRRRIRPTFFNGVYVTQIEHSLFSIPLQLFVVPWLFGFNPPFWNSSADLSLSLGINEIIIAKSLCNRFALVILCNVALLIPSIRRLLDLPVSPGARQNAFVLGLATVAGGMIWVAEGILDHLLLQHNLSVETFFFFSPEDSLIGAVFVFTCLLTGDFITRFIQSRNEADLLLRASEEKYRSLFETMTQGVVYLDAKGCVVSANPAACAILGCAEASLVGQSFPGNNLTWFNEKGEVLTENKDPVRQSLTTGTALTNMTVEVRYPAREARQWWLLNLVQQPGNDGGRNYCLYATFTDITERRLALEERKHLEMRLYHSQKMDAVGQLASGVAHDFNNILQAIQGHTEFARGDVDIDSPAQQSLQEVLQASGRARGLVRQLLAFSRREPIQNEVLDLNDLVYRFAKMIQRIIGKQIELHVTLAKDPKPIFADAGQIEQIIMNLCVNARDAMPEGGHLGISTEHVELDTAFCEMHPWAHTGSHVLLCISDTGTGMTPEVQARAFDPFFTTKPAGQGTGLGLATAYGLIKQHKGFVLLYSTVGQGTTFRIYFPLCCKEVSNPSEEIPPHDVSFAGGNETILVAEDEEVVLGIAVRLLEGAGYTVISAHDGEEAAQRIQRDGLRIDLFMLDVVMPKRPTRDLVRLVRLCNPAAHILLSSGHGMNAPELANLGNQQYPLLTKPYGPQELLKIVRDVLDGPAQT